MLEGYFQYVTHAIEQRKLFSRTWFARARRGLEALGVIHSIAVRNTWHMIRNANLGDDLEDLANADAYDEESVNIMANDLFDDANEEPDSVEMIVSMLSNLSVVQVEKAKETISNAVKTDRDGVVMKVHQKILAGNGTDTDDDDESQSEEEQGDGDHVADKEEDEVNDEVNAEEEDEEGEAGNEENIIGNNDDQSIHRPFHLDVFVYHRGDTDLPGRSPVARSWPSTYLLPMTSATPRNRPSWAKLQKGGASDGTFEVLKVIQLLRSANKEPLKFILPGEWWSTREFHLSYSTRPCGRR